MRATAGYKDRGLKAFTALPERRSLGRSVYENLKGAIIEGSLAPESRVVETRFAEALGISRTPVREAMHKLEREGLLRQDPKGGFYVVGLTREDIEEAFGIRGVLESYAARLATVRHQEEELAPLEEKLVEYRDCLDRGHMEELPRINTDFHDLLYGLSRSPKLVKMINDLRVQIFRFRQVILKIEAMARASNEDHRLMMEAIRARDGDCVEVLVREHILRGQDVVLREFDK
ncbi:MAG: transcriptional regulator [Desulfobacteraceae bacterium 4572_87]|nr:MAG: transcriptional regulator [Desulfobacteraceae bacterium 4572_87]